MRPEVVTNNTTTAKGDIFRDFIRAAMCANRCDRILLCIAIFYMGGAKMRQANKHYIRQLANRHARDIHFTNQLHTSLMHDVVRVVRMCYVCV